MPLLKFGEYEVEPTLLTPDDCEVVPEEKCRTYSIYHRLPENEDGRRYAHWVADFEYRHHAIFFASQLALIKEHFL